MIGEGRSTTLSVVADAGKIGSDKAVSIGLIVTELVINAIKYAFPTDRAGAQVLVSYKSDGADWTLVVSDNGVGNPGRRTRSGRSRRRAWHGHRPGPSEAVGSADGRRQRRRRGKRGDHACAVDITVAASGLIQPTPNVSRLDPNVESALEFN